MARITEAEKVQRHRAVASSQGSLAMEGQSLDPLMLELSRRYAEGELSLEEFGKQVEQHAASLVADRKAKSLALSA